MPATEIVPETVTVKALEASKPALKNALLPAVHWTVELLPKNPVDQFLSVLLFDQVADGVAPAPEVLPLVS